MPSWPRLRHQLYFYISLWSLCTFICIGTSLKQQSSTAIYHFPTKDCPFPFAENKLKFAVSVFRLQKTKRKLPISVISVFRFWNSGNWEKWT
jgi:hypothetical protein